MLLVDQKVHREGMGPWPEDRRTADRGEEDRAGDIWTSQGSEGSMQANAGEPGSGDAAGPKRWGEVTVSLHDALPST